MLWLFNQHGFYHHVHYTPKKKKARTHAHTHTHTHTTTCLPSDNLLFQHALPIFTSADISRHSELHGSVQPTYQEKRPTVLSWPMPWASNFLWQGATTVTVGLFMGCMWGGIVHAIPSCLIIVKILKYTHNLQNVATGYKYNRWAASQRPMSYANSFTDSTVASNIHLLIFTWPMLEYVNAWGGTHANFTIYFIYLGNKEIYYTLKVCCIISVLFSIKCHLFHYFIFTVQIIHFL
jgi:hypothetical protein